MERQQIVDHLTDDSDAVLACRRGEIALIKHINDTALKTLMQ